MLTCTVLISMLRHPTVSLNRAKPADEPGPDGAIRSQGEPREAVLLGAPSGETSDSGRTISLEHEQPAVGHPDEQRIAQLQEGPWCGFEQRRQRVWNRWSGDENGVDLGPVTPDPKKSIGKANEKTAVASHEKTSDAVADLVGGFKVCDGILERLQNRATQADHPAAFSGHPEASFSVRRYRVGRVGEGVWPNLIQIRASIQPEDTLRGDGDQPQPQGPDHEHVIRRKGSRQDFHSRRDGLGEDGANVKGRRCKCAGLIEPRPPRQPDARVRHDPDGAVVAREGPEKQPEYVGDRDRHSPGMKIEMIPRADPDPAQGVLEGGRGDRIDEDGVERGREPVIPREIAVPEDRSHDRLSRRRFDDPVGGPRPQRGSRLLGPADPVPQVGPPPSADPDPPIACFVDDGRVLASGQALRYRKRFLHDPTHNPRDGTEGAHDPEAAPLGASHASDVKRISSNAPVGLERAELPAVKTKETTKGRSPQKAVLVNQKRRDAALWQAVGDSPSLDVYAHAGCGHRCCLGPPPVRGHGLSQDLTRPPDPGQPWDRDAKEGPPEHVLARLKVWETKKPPAQNPPPRGTSMSRGRMVAAGLEPATPTM